MILVSDYQGTGLQPSPRLRLTKQGSGLRVKDLVPLLEGPALQAVALAKAWGG